MMDTLFWISVVMFIQSRVCSELNIHSDMYNTQNNVQASGAESTLEQTYVNSEIACAHACTVHEFCCVSFYKHNTQECLIEITGRCDVQTKQATGVTLFIKKGCLKGWKRFRNHCYLMPNKKLDWSNSEKECVKMGAHLVKIDNAEENTWIKEKGNRQDVWIGLNDLAEEGTWRWISDNSEAEFQDWHPNEPYQSRDSNCVQLWDLNGRYQWDDARCEDDNQSFLCETKFED